MPIDSLVLRIDEIEATTGNIDTTLFIIYDAVNEEYLVRGSRRGNFTPYSFVSLTMDDMMSFVEWAIGIHNRVSYTLLNYNDLPFHSQAITYQYLCENYNIQCNEIVGYDNCKLKFRDRFLKNYLRLLRNIFNHYEETV